LWAGGLGPTPQTPNPQSPIPNPQSPIPNLFLIIKENFISKTLRLYNIEK